MSVHVTEKERTALLNACDFISTNADGAEDYSTFQEMQDGLMSLFKKAKQNSENIRKKRFVRNYLKNNTTQNTQP